jgi:hypothetical protein
LFLSRVLRYPQLLLASHWYKPLASPWFKPLASPWFKPLASPWFRSPKGLLNFLGALLVFLLSKFLQLWLVNLSYKMSKLLLVLLFSRYHQLLPACPWFKPLASP